MTHDVNIPLVPQSCFPKQLLVFHGNGSAEKVQRIMNQGSLLILLSSVPYPTPGLSGWTSWATSFLLGPYTLCLNRECDKQGRWPPPKPHLSPRRHLPVSTGTHCSSLFFSSSWASIWHSLSSMLPCLSPACWPRTVSAPLATTLS